MCGVAHGVWRMVWRRVRVAPIYPESPESENNYAA
jgi:hypothetical protein